MTTYEKLVRWFEDNAEGINMTQLPQMLFPDGSFDLKELADYLDEGKSSHPPAALP